jgi:Zn-dependent protease
MMEFLLALPVLLVSVVTHEYAHGYAALRQGDPTAKQLGRLTFNPLKHIDPWMSLLLPAMLWFGSSGQFVFGGAKPVPINPNNFRNYRRGDIIVSSAGIVANLVLFVVFLALSVAVGIVGGMMPFGLDGWIILQRMLLFGVWMNALLAFFNLIPIPPLDGSHILFHFLPPKLAQKYRELARYGFLILLGMMILFRDYFFLLLMPAVVATRFAIDLVQPFLLQSAPF